MAAVGLPVAAPVPCERLSPLGCERQGESFSRDEFNNCGRGHPFTAGDLRAQSTSASPRRSRTSLRACRWIVPPNVGRDFQTFQAVPKPNDRPVVRLDLQSCTSVVHLYHCDVDRHIKAIPNTQFHSFTRPLRRRGCPRWSGRGRRCGHDETARRLPDVRTPWLAGHRGGSRSRSTSSRRWRRGVRV